MFASADQVKVAGRGGPVDGRSRGLTRLSLAAIDWYKSTISPKLGDRCRYEIGCAAYMRLAIVKHGFLLGAWRGARRILSCGPWSSRPYSDAP